MLQFEAEELLDGIEFSDERFGKGLVHVMKEAEGAIGLPQARFGRRTRGPFQVFLLEMSHSLHTETVADLAKLGDAPFAEMSIGLT